MSVEHEFDIHGGCSPYCQGCTIERLQAEVAQRDADMRLREAWFNEQCEAFERDKAAMTQERDALRADLDGAMLQSNKLCDEADAAEQSLAEVRAERDEMDRAHAGVCVEAARKLAEVRGALEWRPFSTAPHDGTWVLACIDDSTPIIVQFSQYGTGWQTMDDGPYVGLTHWMPLPPPAPRLGGGVGTYKPAGSPEEVHERAEAVRAAPDPFQPEPRRTEVGEPSVENGQRSVEERLESIAHVEKSDGFDSRGCCDDCQRTRAEGHQGSCDNHPRWRWKEPR
jgi:hypothetical protein